MLNRLSGFTGWSGVSVCLLSAQGIKPFSPYGTRAVFLRCVLLHQYRRICPGILYFQNTKINAGFLSVRPKRETILFLYGFEWSGWMSVCIYIYFFNPRPNFARKKKAMPIPGKMLYCTHSLLKRELKDSRVAEVKKIQARKFEVRWYI